MSELHLQVCADVESFAAAWRECGYDDTEVEHYWALLGELEPGELLIHLPEWLAEQKVGYVEGATPTAFVGRIDGETEQAIRFVDATGARKLSRVADRIRSLEESIARLESEAHPDEERLEWLERRLAEKRETIETREGLPMLSEEWLPKSQIEFIGRRTPSSTTDHRETPPK